MSQAKFVYMLVTDYRGFPRDGEWLVKIGIAKSIKNRFSNIQSGCPFKLRVQASGKTENAEMHEMIIHEKLSHLRTRGEWFLIDDESFDFVVDYLRDITSQFRSSNKQNKAAIQCNG